MCELSCGNFELVAFERSEAPKSGDCLRSSGAVDGHEDMERGVVHNFECELARLRRLRRVPGGQSTIEVFRRPNKHERPAHALLDLLRMCMKLHSGNAASIPVEGLGANLCVHSM